MVWLYPKACRRCYESPNGDIISRTLSGGTELVCKMWELYNKPAQRQKAYEESQKLQQHIGVSPLMKLESFDLYQQTPACSGHSENQGRTKRHLLENFNELSGPVLNRINARLKNIAKFPGLSLHSSSSSTTFTQLILTKKSLTAEEYQSARAVILFLLVGLQTDDEQYLWRLHVEYAAGYYKKEWSPYNREYWQFLRAKFQSKFDELYPGIKYPKGHDPKHDDELIEQFGSFLNLDEMIFENCHQTSKNQPTNGKAITEQLLVKDSNPSDGNFVSSSSNHVSGIHAQEKTQHLEITRSTTKRRLGDHQLCLEEGIAGTHC